MSFINYIDFAVTYKLKDKHVVANFLQLEQKSALNVTRSILTVEGWQCQITTTHALYILRLQVVSWSKSCLKLGHVLFLFLCSCMQVGRQSNQYLCMYLIAIKLLLQ